MAGDALKGAVSGWPVGQGIKHRRDRLSIQMDGGFALIPFDFRFNFRVQFEIPF